MADGPGPTRQQDAKAWICSTDLVPCLQRSPPVPLGPHFRTCIDGVHGGGRYLHRNLLSLWLLVFTICSGTRIREGVRAFLDECAKAGRSEKTAHYLYVNGMDSKGEKLSVQVHLQRGASLSRLTDMWLNTWGEEEED